ncbi:MAG: hypothetical protein WAO41_08870 [Candidatus Nanopelagicales bacterium]
MGMFEYGVRMSEARDNGDMKFVADAYRAGAKQQIENILEAVKPLSKNGQVSEAWFKIEEIIRETEKK